MIYFVSGILIGSLGAFITIFSISGYTKKKGFFISVKIHEFLVVFIYIIYIICDLDNDLRRTRCI